MGKFKRKEDIDHDNKKATAILCSDIHFRPSVPRCRTDDFIRAMMKKWEHLLHEAYWLEIPIIVAGDLGEHAQWPPWLEEWFISASQLVKIILVPGQHDLPNHRLDLWKKSSIGVLEAAGAIEVLTTGCEVYDSKFALYAFPYGTEIGYPSDQGLPTFSPNIAVAHTMVIEDKPLWPGQEAPKGHQLLKKFPEYDVILTGDNHNRFDVEYEGRWLVNPGSMMRTKADQVDHRPGYYVWIAETGEIETEYFAIEQGVISREHIDIEKDKDERIGNFIAHLKDGYEIDLDFEKNLEGFFATNRTRKAVKDIAWEFVQGEQDE